jgi:hypothetical protein
MTRNPPQPLAMMGNNWQQFPDLLKLLLSTQEAVAIMGSIRTVRASYGYE